MYTFFFNSELLPHCSNLPLFNTYFSCVLKTYSKLLDDKELNIQQGIISEKMPSELSLGAFSLDEAINKLEAPLRRVAYSYFTKYPIENCSPIEEELLIQQYIFYIEQQCINALYVTQIASQKGFLFSVALCDELRSNKLELISQDGNTPNLPVNNLFCKESHSGLECNANFIRAYIKRDIFDKKTNLLEKLEILVNAQCSSKFKDQFENLSKQEKESILALFEQAKSRQLTPVFSPDGYTIKDVSPEKPKDNIRVYELRVFTPTALRVYFYETKEKIFIASLGKKSNSDQTKDIKNAEGILVRMLRENI